MSNILEIAGFWELIIYHEIIKQTEIQENKLKR